MKFVLNGELLQEGTTAQMIHTVPEQIVYASNIVTLRPGDVIATGTPPGVGSARNPPILLKAGDRMECSYDGVEHADEPRRRAVVSSSLRCRAHRRAIGGWRTRRCREAR